MSVYLRIIEPVVENHEEVSSGKLLRCETFVVFDDGSGMLQNHLFVFESFDILVIKIKQTLFKQKRFEGHVNEGFLGLAAHALELDTARIVKNRLLELVLAGVFHVARAWIVEPRVRVVVGHVVSHRIFAESGASRRVVKTLVFIGLVFIEVGAPKVVKSEPFTFTRSNEMRIFIHRMISFVEQVRVLYQQIQVMKRVFLDRQLSFIEQTIFEIIHIHQLNLVINIHNRLRQQRIRLFNHDQINQTLVEMVKIKASQHVDQHFLGVDFLGRHSSFTDEHFFAG